MAEKNEKPAEKIEKPAPNPAPAAPLPIDDSGADPTPPKEPKPAAGLDIGQIGAAMLEQWPKGQPHFIDQIKKEISIDADKQTAAVDFRLLTDKNGHYYDPVYCSTTIDLKTGIPEKLKGGAWKMRGKNKRSALSTKKPKIDPHILPEYQTANDPAAEQAAALASRQALEDQCYQTAKTVDFLAWIMIEQMTKQGADPQTQKNGIEATKNYLMTLENPPTPPAWAMPILIYGQAGFGRLMQPEAADSRKSIKGKLHLLGAYIKGVLFGRKMRKVADHG